MLHQLSLTGDWISSWWTVALLVVAAVAVVVLLVVLAVRRRRRPAPARRWPHRVGTTLGALGAVVLLLVAGVVGVNAYSGYAPNVAAARTVLVGWGVLPQPAHDRWNPAEIQGDATHGAVHTVQIPATAAERMSGGPAWVYTPPGYDHDSGTRYPVMYLFHGSPGQPSDWFAAADGARAMDVMIAHGLVPPMILVSVDVNGTGPSASDTECLDSTTGGSQVETYVTQTVVPWVDQNMPTVADRDHRVVGGASSGGFCALNLGLRHTDLFSSVVAMMPYGEPGSGGAAMLSTPAEISANTPLDYVPTMTFTDPVAVFIDNGADSSDAELEDGYRLTQMLRDRGQTVELREEPDQEHTWTMVGAGFPYALRFVGQQLGVDLAAGTS